MFQEVRTSKIAIFISTHLAKKSYNLKLLPHIKALRNEVLILQCYPHLKAFVNELQRCRHHLQLFLHLKKLRNEVSQLYNCYPHLKALVKEVLELWAERIPGADSRLPFLGDEPERSQGRLVQIGRLAVLHRTQQPFDITSHRWFFFFGGGVLSLLFSTWVNAR